jgi:hypothetical protein
MTTWHDLDGKRIVDVIGEFTDYDALIEQLRERAATVGLSYRNIDELTGLGEGGTAKYLADLRVKRLTIESLQRINRVLGIKGVFVINPAAGERLVALAELGDRCLTVEAVLEISRAFGIKGVFVIDPDAAAEMAPDWGQRDAKRAHARRLAPVGKMTLQRMLPAVAGEYGRRGGVARMAKMTPDARRAFSLAAARARWRHKKQMEVRALILRRDP